MSPTSRIYAQICSATRAKWTSSNGKQKKKNPNQNNKEEEINSTVNIQTHTKPKVWKSKSGFLTCKSIKYTCIRAAAFVNINAAFVSLFRCLLPSCGSNLTSSHIRFDVQRRNHICCGDVCVCMPATDMCVCDATTTDNDDDCLEIELNCMKHVHKLRNNEITLLLLALNVPIKTKNYDLSRLWWWLFIRHAHTLVCIFGIRYSHLAFYFYDRARARADGRHVRMEEKMEKHFLHFYYSFIYANNDATPSASLAISMRAHRICSQFAINWDNTRDTQAHAHRTPEIWNILQACRKRRYENKCD